MSAEPPDRERRLRDSYESSGVFLYVETYDRLVSLARSRGAGAETAADVVQDAFAVLFEKRPKVKSPEAWLKRIVRRRCVDLGRRRRSESRWLERQPSDSTLSAPEGDALLRKRLRITLASLPEKMRSLLWRRFIEGHDEPTAARLAGYSPGSYKRTATRSLARLREALETETSRTESIR